MIDLGITSAEVGVAAPADGRKLKMVIKDDAGVRDRRYGRCKSNRAERLVVKW